MYFRVLSDNANFRYYQGFHDICLTLLLVMSAEKALRTMRTLTRRTCFRNYLISSLEESAMSELQHLYVILYLHDPELEQHMRNAELGTLFALSWVLTWFSHDLQEYSQVNSDGHVLG